MLEAKERNYYRQRERTARQHAAGATDPAVAAAHNAMADRYAALLINHEEECGAQKTQTEAPV